MGSLALQIFTVQRTSVTSGGELDGPAGAGVAPIECKCFLRQWKTLPGILQSAELMNHIGTRCFQPKYYRPGPGNKELYSLHSEAVGLWKFIKPLMWSFKSWCNSLLRMSKFTFDLFCFLLGFISMPQDNVITYYTCNVYFTSQYGSIHCYNWPEKQPYSFVFLFFQNCAHSSFPANLSFFIFHFLNVLFNSDLWNRGVYCPLERINRM